MRSPSFSIVLIARNESKTLSRLVASLAEFQTRGGEIVLVDTGSTDNTAALARDLGVKVHEEGERFITRISQSLAKRINDRFIARNEPLVVTPGDKLFDYAAARNYAASLSSKDMIAMPDCDEAFTRLDLEAINAAIDEGVTQLEYNFVFSHDQYGAQAIKFLHSKFYDRRKLHWVGVVHEVLQGEATRRFFPEDQIKLEHWQNPSPHRSRYLSGLALDCFQNPGNDRNSHYFAREMLWTGRPWSALREFERHIAMRRWPVERAQSMIFMGDAYLAVGKEELGLQSYHRAILTDGGRREAWLRLAHFCMGKDDLQRVACYASAALTIPWSSYFANQHTHYTYEPHELLYRALWWLKDREGAKAHWRKALEYQPLHLKFIDDGQFFVTPHGNQRVGVLAYMIREGIHFSFVKLGDGEQTAVDLDRGVEMGTCNCDGHPYSVALGQRLKKAFTSLSGRALVFNFGDQKHFNMLLHRTDSDLRAVREFYKTIHESSAHKVFIGPKRLEGVKDFLRAKFIEVPLVDAFSQYDAILEQLKAELKPGGIYCFSAGPPAKCLIADLLDHAQTQLCEITCLDTGSAFDPIFVGETRTNQADRQELEKLYIDMLPFPKVSIIIPTLGRAEKLSRLLRLIDQNASYTNYQVLIDYDQMPPRNVGVPKMVKSLVSHAKGELVMYLGNDCMPEKDFLFLAVKRFQEEFPDGVGLVGLNDGYWHGEFATHWLASKSLLPLLDGEFFHCGYHHTGCDNELTERARMHGKYVWAEEAKVFHDHPINSGFKEGDDEVYRLAWDPERRKHDLDLLQERSRKLGFPYYEFYSKPELVPA